MKYYSTLLAFLCSLFCNFIPLDGYSRPKAVVVTGFVYEKMGVLSEGLIAVRKDNCWGYIDTAGQQVLPFIYQDARRFSEELAAVKMGDKWGYIDKGGNVIIPFRYQDAPYPFTGGIARVCTNRNGGFINKQGKLIASGYRCDPYSNSEEYVLVENKESGKEGILDTRGNEVIPCMYDQLQLFYDGDAPAKIGDRWGHIDENNNVTTAFIYDCTWGFNEGLAPVKINGKWGYINKRRNTVIPFEYLSAGHAQYGMGRVMDENKKWGLVDTTERIRLPFIYDDIWYTFRCGMTVVTLNGKKGVINTKCKNVLKCKYENIRITYNGLLWVKQEGKWGLITPKGKIILPFQYDDASPLSGNFSEVKKGNSYALAMHTV